MSTYHYENRAGRYVRAVEYVEAVGNYDLVLDQKCRWTLVTRWPRVELKGFDELVAARRFARRH